MKHGADTVAVMLELAADLLPLLESGVPVAAVTVTRVVRSAPRGVGATLAVTQDARVIGSISGGCVEGDAVMLGLDALRTGTVRRGRFGFVGPDDAIVAAGLACGGAVEVAAYPVDGHDPRVRAALLDAAAGRETTLELALDDDLPLLLHRPARPRLIVLGAREQPPVGRTPLATETPPTPERGPRRNTARHRNAARDDQNGADSTRPGGPAALSSSGRNRTPDAGASEGAAG